MDTIESLKKSISTSLKNDKSHNLKEIRERKEQAEVVEDKPKSVQKETKEKPSEKNHEQEEPQEKPKYHEPEVHNEDLDSLATKTKRKEEEDVYNHVRKGKHDEAAIRRSFGNRELHKGKMIKYGKDLPYTLHHATKKSKLVYLYI